MEFSANDPPAIKTAVHTWIIIEVLPASITSGVYKYFSGFSGARLVYYKHFSGAGKVCINTSPAQEMRFQILPRLLRRQRSVFKYFPGAAEVFLYIYSSDISPAPEKPGKCLKTPILKRRRSIYAHLLFRRRRSAYLHLFGAGEAGEAGEVFIHP